MSTPDFFRSHLDVMIDLRHPLAILANRMPWASIEATLTPMFKGCAREGRVSEEVDLAGPTSYQPK
jgi:IS5 family transposase